MMQESGKKLRFGQIGCGDIAQIRYLPTYPVARYIELGAICDGSAERLIPARGVFREAVYYDNYCELLQDQSLDAVTWPSNKLMPMRTSRLSRIRYST